MSKLKFANGQTEFACNDYVVMQSSDCYRLLLVVQSPPDPSLWNLYVMKEYKIVDGDLIKISDKTQFGIPHTLYSPYSQELHLKFPPEKVEELLFIHNLSKIK